MCTLFSIGHGQKNIEEFIAQLRHYRIQCLVDVRSVPYSKWAPQYNREELHRTLRAEGFTYGYMGQLIGGRPQSEYCYDEEGYISYRAMAGMPDFQTGIRRLLDANEKGYRTAIMCSETNPADCHRSKLIGRELYALDPALDMTHIITAGQIIKETQIIHMLAPEWTAPTADANTYDGLIHFDEFATTPSSPLPYFRSRKPHFPSDRHNPYFRP